MSMSFIVSEIIVSSVTLRTWLCRMSFDIACHQHCWLSCSKGNTMLDMWLCLNRRWRQPHGALC